MVTRSVFLEQRSVGSWSAHVPAPAGAAARLQNLPKLNQPPGKEGRRSERAPQHSRGSAAQPCATSGFPQNTPRRPASLQNGQASTFRVCALLCNFGPDRRAGWGFGVGALSALAKCTRNMEARRLGTSPYRRGSVLVRVVRWLAETEGAGSRPQAPRPRWWRPGL